MERSNESLKKRSKAVRKLLLKAFDENEGLAKAIIGLQLGEVHRDISRFFSKEELNNDKE